MSVISISAEGTRGKVKGKPFFAKQSRGKYVLHSKSISITTGKPLRFAVNKVLVNTLDEAALLLKAGDHHIRVYNEEHKQWNLRSPEQVFVKK
ncbi:hypothetical protein ACQKE0_13385 [Shewanella colwelliana]|uniref:hypothetical protein n=1 Tax=Shewanella colwelliana TaxID=23 RepID=UPI003D03CA91